MTLSFVTIRHPEYLEHNVPDQLHYGLAKMAAVVVFKRFSAANSNALTFIPLDVQMAIFFSLLHGQLQASNKEKILE